MILLIIGVAVFFGVHLLPSLPIKNKLTESIGETKYKMGFSLISILGLGLIIYGFMLSEFVPLWTPLPWGRDATMIAMPIAAVFLCAANTPNNIKRWVHHPMLLGIAIWSGTHLAANGDLASTIIFASFGFFAIFDIASVTLSHRSKKREPVSKLWDLGVVVVGLLLTGVLFYFHGSLTGIPLM